MEDVEMVSDSVEDLCGAFSAIKYDPSKSDEALKMGEKLVGRANKFLEKVLPQGVEYTIGVDGLFTVVDGTVRIYVFLKRKEEPGMASENVNPAEIVANLKAKVPSADVYFQIAIAGLFVIPVAEFDRMIVG